MGATRAETMTQGAAARRAARHRRRRAARGLARDRRDDDRGDGRRPHRLDLTINPLDSVTTVTVQIVTLLIGDTGVRQPEDAGRLRARPRAVRWSRCCLNVVALAHRAPLPRAVRMTAGADLDDRRAVTAEPTTPSATPRTRRRRRYAADAPPAALRHRRDRRSRSACSALLLVTLMHRRLPGLHPDASSASTSRSRPIERRLRPIPADGNYRAVVAATALARAPARARPRRAGPRRSAAS